MRYTVFLAVITALMSACGGGGSGGTPANSGNPGNSGNTAPMISGQPSAAVVYSNNYSFTPEASDPDGDGVFFEITNIPFWASFEPATGELSGRPALGDVGVYDNIVISASDGIEDTALPAFSITVLENALGTITLSWQPPTQNVDGSPLLDLAGYIIHYGTDSKSYDKENRIENPGITTYVIENLLPGTYYIAATSFNSDGVESVFSGEVTATVD